MNTEKLIKQAKVFFDLKQYQQAIDLYKILYKQSGELVYIKNIAYLYYLKGDEEQAIKIMVFYYNEIDNRNADF